ncbi:MAG TPA: protein kinase [Steroidobacteraceae bacterium]|jgi:non-specific serine/threonine protein kinase/serine/threonine-protein kinase|nr:protein kinase [Steroidobacteraceae bacterium]
MPTSNHVTAPLSPAQRVRVDELLDGLFDLPETERLANLRAMRIEDSAVLAEVESLLHAASASGGFLSMSPKPASDELVTDGTLGMRIGAWRIMRLIGRGGMGEVYEATRADGNFEQRVAIKLLQREAAAQMQRFQAERQILARLEHPGIARLYDGGVTEDGRPFMVMEFVEGRPITEYCQITQATFEQRLGLFIQVCDAVAYAHRNLVVHRDLKPSNILVTPSGAVKLLDFGIAKLLDAQRARVTQAAAMPMTPICAAPEQLTGGDITTATDVYALGLLLFELLSGTHPWMGSDTPVLQAMRTVLQKPAPSVSHSAEAQPNPPVPVRLIRGDLDAIVAKALRKEPADRYATVNGIKLDVERAMRGAPVEAREGARLYVISRTLRRFRWAAAAVAAVIVSLAVGLGVAAWQAEKAAQERDVARRDAAREEAVRYNLTGLFRAAISDQGGKSPTAKGMIDNSAQRVLNEYRDQPQLKGQIVLTLADLYGALEDVNGSATLLEGFLAQADSKADPLAVADARQKLANIELLRGHATLAKELLGQAENFWRASPGLYAEERLEGLGTRARLQRAQGDIDGAIATIRDAIAQRIALSGHDNRETALLFNSLAISLGTVNRLPEALKAYYETTAIYRALGLGDGIDAQIIVANTGTLEMRAGHLREAEALLKSSVERERALAGDSAAVAAAMSYYGRILSITNRNEPAISVLKQAAEMAARYAGPESPVALQARIFLGEALLANAAHAEAATTLTDAYQAARKAYGAAHPLTLRAEIAAAQLAASENNYPAAQAQFAEAAAGLHKLGAQSAATLAMALENLGTVESAQGRNTEAEAVLKEAVAIREKTPDDIWELAIAEERLGEALAKSGSPGAQTLLKKAGGELESQLGANHPQTLRAKAALARLGA